MSSVLIIEDEPPSARRLGRLVQLKMPSAEITYADTLAMARDTIGERHFDIICLDLNLHGHDGFRALEQLSETSAVIVVSAQVDRALEAFEHGVADFVPKPVAAQRFDLALARAVERGQEGPRAQTTIALRWRGGVEMVDLSNIRSVSTLDDYSELMLVDGRHVLDDRTLAAIETHAKGMLIRVHRSHLANVKHIAGLAQKNGNWVLQLDGDMELPVSRRKLKSVKRILSD